MNTPNDSKLSRRTILKGAAWSTPVLAAAVAAPLASASREPTCDTLSVDCEQASLVFNATGSGTNGPWSGTASLTLTLVNSSSHNMDGHIVNIIVTHVDGSSTTITGVTPDFQNFNGATLTFTGNFTGAAHSYPSFISVEFTYKTYDMVSNEDPCPYTIVYEIGDVWAEDLSEGGKFIVEGGGSLLCAL